MRCGTTVKEQDKIVLPLPPRGGKVNCSGDVESSDGKEVAFDVLYPFHEDV